MIATCLDSTLPALQPMSAYQDRLPQTLGLSRQSSNISSSYKTYRNGKVSKFEEHVAEVLWAYSAYCPLLKDEVFNAQAAILKLQYALELSNHGDSEVHLIANAA